MVDPNRIGDLLVGHPNHPRRALGNNFQRLGQRLATSQPVSKGVGRIGADHTALLDTLRIGIGVRGHNPDNLGLQAQQVAGLDQPANARAHADGYIHGVQFFHCF